MIKDTYKSIEKISEGIFRDKGSKFIATLHPISHPNDLKELIIQSKKNHPKSRHHCFGYVIGINSEPSNSSDDGEPSGSAGRPILGQLRSYELSDCAAIVVRYFGGTKLGIPGLIHAYKEATRLAIENNTIITKQLSTAFSLHSTYEHMGKILDAFKRSDIELKEKHFNEDIRLIFDIPNSEVSQKLHLLKAYLLGINPKELKEDLQLDGIQITEV